jgi:MinD superfamily P-loop ATPase
LNDSPRQVAVLSGKGGTGKTTVAASFACLAIRPVIADCDVDAPNLSLILQGRVRSSHPFSGSLKAEIDPLKCTHCGKCEDHCRFLAITDFLVNPMACEGCGVCLLVCPVEAVSLRDVSSGEIHIWDTQYGVVVDAEMSPGESNSGRMVAKVRALAIEQARLEHSNLLIIDGPPGTGCPVISSITGTDLVIIVTEPTASGWHDLKRVVELTNHFGIPCGIIVNKFDLNLDLTMELVGTLASLGIRMLGSVPYDENVEKAMMSGLPLPVYSPYSPSTVAIRSIWEGIRVLLKEPPGQGPAIRVE